MDRRDLLEIFRGRLTEAMGRGGLTQAALARRVGLDRSTLAQFLAVGNKRLPRADTLAALLDLDGLGQKGGAERALLGETQEPVDADLLVEGERCQGVGPGQALVPRR